MFTATFWKSAAERAIKTIAQAAARAGNLSKRAGDEPVL